MWPFKSKPKIELPKPACGECPFDMDSISQVTIYMSTSCSGSKYISGGVEFNGKKNFNGKQNFRGKNFENLVAKMQPFIDAFEGRGV